MQQKKVSSLAAPLITAILFLFLIGTTLTLAQTATTEPIAERAVISEELRQEVQKYGEIPIIITLDVSSYNAFRQAAEADGADLTQLEQISRDIHQTADHLLNRLSTENISQIKRYDHFPFLAMIVDETALEAIAAERSVTHIALDVPVPPAMDDTVPLIGANNNHFLNYTGSGWSVAILDTGVDKSHPSLAGKVISEACYSSNVPSQGASSLCPGGAASSTANNSALPCAIGISGCDHGTHVADIAARVAPGARIIPIQVFSRFTDSPGNTLCQNANRTSPCTLSYTSDQISALSRVLQLHILANGINVAAANMSLGGGFHTAPCDTLSEYVNLRIAIEQLRNQNVATVIAAGNNGYRNGMGAPACLTLAISVAASDKNDQVASFSNISPLTTLIAPGTPILAAVPTTYTPIYQPKGGTSMAAPHVAGAIATFKEGRPNATVPQIITALTSTSPTITDQRSGGTVTKRRLNTWAALCNLITCDVDDFRTMSINQTLNGVISPAGDVDHYYFFGTAGQRLTLRMNRTSGSIDPYLELISPSGFRVAFNDNGGGGVNALINGYLLPQNGLYQIRARSLNNFTGNYQISASAQVETLNPVPQITRFSPTSATGTFFGSDFWVAIYGSNFMPESQVRWNGQLRAKFYSSPTLIYIRVLGGDIGLPWPRNAFITVVNPTPGGGTSNARAFSINAPFLGESSLLSPDSGSSVPAGEKQTFEVEWVAPTETGTWRDMQYMDMRLRNEVGETAAWVRVVEQAGENSFYRLLNAHGELVDEGSPGEARDLVLTDTVTLHLADSAFSGSGLVATMTPVLTFGPAAVGTYNVEFRVDSKSREDDELNVQDDDVLGVFSVLPGGCNTAVSDVSISGAGTGQTVLSYDFTANVTPGGATGLSYSWSPEPNSGQGTVTATYQWDTAGEKIVSVNVENCGGFAADVHTIQMRTTSAPDLSIMKEGPATAVSEQPFTYTFTVMNSGQNTANNLVVRDTLPAGATYVSSSAGGTLQGNEVVWNIAQLEGYGATAQVSLTVTANANVTNSTYSVSAQGGHSATGASPVTTQIVDAQLQATAVTTQTLSYSNQATITVSGGNVFEDTVVTYRRLSAPGFPAPAGSQFAGHAFQLNAYQNNQLVTGFQFGDAVQMALATGSSGGIVCTAVATPATQYALFKTSSQAFPQLYYRTGSQWSDAGVTCGLNLYLPMVIRN